MYTVKEVNLSYPRQHLVNSKKVSCSSNSYEVLREVWDDDLDVRESFWVLYLNNANQIKCAYQLSKGGITGTVADVRMIFSVALKTLSTSLVLAHNHPSGNLKPSHSDRVLTNKMRESGQLLDIVVLDHLILSPNDSYLSFADEGLL